MFDWFWEFLYSLSKALMKICDWLMDVALSLIGIEKITVGGEQTDFLSYLLRSERVTFGFKAAFALGVLILFLFTIFSIINNVIKEGEGRTPGQIVVKALKALLGFLLVPAIMIVATSFLNEFMTGLYNATKTGQGQIGDYLFEVFSSNAWRSDEARQLFLSGQIDWRITDQASSVIILKEFEFLFSWVTGALVAYNLMITLILFVERAISIIILYISAPFSIGSSVLDDGAHMKTWREQVINKFIAAYGAVIAMNIFIMMTGLVIDESVIFFSSGALNKVTKIMIIIGGAFSLRRATILVSELLTPGSGMAMGDSLSTGGRLADSALGAGKTVGGFALGLAGKGIKAAWNKAHGKNADGSNPDPVGDKLEQGAQQGAQQVKTSTNTNTKKPTYNQKPKQNDLLKDALGGDNNPDNKKNNNILNNPNVNNNQQQEDKKKYDLITKALLNDGEEEDLR